MTPPRRASVLRPTTELTAAVDAVPEAIEGEAAIGIRTSGPPPLAPTTGEPTVVWVHANLPGAVAPPASFACTVDDATRWAKDGPPAWLHRRRLDGVLVQYGADSPAAVRRAARALRERLAPTDVAGLRDMARAWGSDALLTATSRLTGQRAPTFADLARALSRSDDPEATRLARLCWALEHL